VCELCVSLQPQERNLLLVQFPRSPFLANFRMADKRKMALVTNHNNALIRITSGFPFTMKGPYRVSAGRQFDTSGTDARFDACVLLRSL
jgi:hypothetical protein